MALSANDVREPELTQQLVSETAARGCDTRGKREEILQKYCRSLGDIITKSSENSAEASSNSCGNPVEILQKSYRD